MIGLDVDALYRAHNDHVLRALRRTFPRADEARLEDGLQHAWTQLCGKRPEWIDPDRDPAAWLFTVARNHVRRGYTRGGEDDDVSALAAPTHVAEQVIAREQMSLLEHLPVSQRTALTCRMLGLSYVEAGAATGRTYTWVNRHTREGRAALRALVAA